MLLERKISLWQTRLAEGDQQMLTNVDLYIEEKDLNRKRFPLFNSTNSH